MSHTDTVNAFIAAIEAKDIAAAAALASPDISYENVPMQPVVGREAMAAVLERFVGNAGGVEWIMVSQIEADGMVCNERIDRFEIGDSWLEIPVAGVFRFDDEGLIALWRDYFDLATYTDQLAALTSE